MVRNVGLLLFFCDDGRFVLNTAFFGARLYYVPEPHVQPASRRFVRMVLAAFAIALIALGGVILGRWSVWWFVLAMAAAWSAPAVARWTIRNQLSEVTDPAVVRAIRHRIAFQHEGSLGSALVSTACCGMYAVEWAVRHPTAQAFLIIAITFLVLLGPAAYWARERRLLDRDATVQR